MKFVKVVSRLSRAVFGPVKIEPYNSVKDADTVSDIIYNELMSEKASMIARYGATELSCVINYLGVKAGRPNIFRYLVGKELDWWWNKNLLQQLEQWSGFFPPSIPNVERFCQLILNDSEQLDILASWLSDERRLDHYIGTDIFIQLLFLDPFWSKRPWTRALEGRKVLIVHPFAELISKQYTERRKELFTNQLILPEFTLYAIPAVQSLGGEVNGFSDWFEALHWMEDEIDKVDYDICLIGCGAYGFPLAAHVKRQGKKAVHMGGSLQLLFGIIGKRWENPAYGAKELGETGKYPALVNKYWVRPGNVGAPKNADKVEGGCYW